MCHQLGQHIKLYMGQEVRTASHGMHAPYWIKASTDTMNCVRSQSDAWLEDDDNLDKWESNSLAACDRRILLATWYFAACHKLFKARPSASILNTPVLCWRQMVPMTILFSLKELQRAISLLFLSPMKLRSEFILKYYTYISYYTCVIKYNICSMQIRSSAIALGFGSATLRSSAIGKILSFLMGGTNCIRQST